MARCDLDYQFRSFFNLHPDELDDTIWNPRTREERRVLFNYPSPRIDLAGFLNPQAAVPKVHGRYQSPPEHVEFEADKDRAVFINQDALRQNVAVSRGRRTDKSRLGPFGQRVQNANENTKQR